MDKYDQDLKSILPETGWEERMATARNAAAGRRRHTYHIQPPKASESAGRAGSPESQPGRESQNQVGRPGGQNRTGSYGRTAQPGREPQGQAARFSQQERGRQPQSSQTTSPARSAGPSRTIGAGQTGGPHRTVNRSASQPAGPNRGGNRRPPAGRKRKRKKNLMPAMIAAVVVVLVIIVASVLLITNYGRGSSSNQRGLALYEEGSYDEAVTMFLQALERDPQNGEYYNNLGMAYTAAGQYDEALAAFDNAAASSNRDSVLELAKRGSGIAYLSAGHYSKAVDLFNEALTYAPENYGDTELDILYYLAEAQERAGDTIGAVETYTRIISYDDSADAYMLRGLAYQSAGDNASAEADLETAISQSRRNYKTYLALYEVLMAQDKTDEAAQILDDALELGGKTGEDYSNRGIIYMYKEDYAGAQEAFNTALENGYHGAYLGLAESLMRQEDYEGAAAQYEAYLAVDSQNAEAYNQYGLCLMSLSRYEDARTAFEQGLALNDRLVDRELMYNEAITYEYLEDWTGALEKMQAFVEKYPDDSQGQHELAFLERFQ